MKYNLIDLMVNIIGLDLRNRVRLMGCSVGLIAAFQLNRYLTPNELWQMHSKKSLVLIGSWSGM